MRTLAHISDLHFGRIDPVIVDGLVAELNATRLDLVVVSGDFTQGARLSEFRQAQSFLARLEPPWLGIPGNHDISPYHLVQRFFDPFARFRRFIAPTTEPIWHDDEIAVVGLNSARRAMPGLDWSQGRISRNQLERTAEKLRALPRHLFRIAVVHHPLLPPPHAPETRLVGRSSEALMLFDELGVKLTLAGHLHRGYARFLEPVLKEGQVADTHVRPPERTATRRLLTVQAGSATSTRLRGERNAYNHIRIEDGIAAIEPRLWNGRAWVNAEAIEGDESWVEEAFAAGTPVEAAPVEASRGGAPEAGSGARSQSR